MLPLNLNFADTCLLYGPTIWQLGGQIIALSGKIHWYPKPNSRITCILRNDEFGDKKLTDLLKKIITALNIPTDHISFGRADAPFESELISKAPDNYVIIFNPNLCPNLSTVNELFAKQIFVVPSLQDMEMNVAYKAKTWEILKQLKEKI
ncbi:MAG: hypothetical protein LC115_13100 [Bacteroidia bacterium]|nr:hypothetical protein [Bacteroidia bacterium]